MVKNYTCLPDSFAIAIGYDRDEFIKLLGHGGIDSKGQIVGWHIQECIDVLWHHGYSCTPIEFDPSSKISEKSPIYYPFSQKQALNRAHKYLADPYYFGAVLEGINIQSKLGHAVAYLNGVVIDPRGINYPFADCELYGFDPHTLWLITSKDNP